MKFLSFVLAILFAGLRTSGSEPVAVGITEPILDVVLSASVPGLIGARNFQEGASVKKGEVIVELNKTLEELEAHRRKLVVDTLRNDLEATRTLFKSTKSVSKEELEKKELEYQVALAEYNIARENLERKQIVAPFSGTITELTLDVGEAAQAYQPLARLVDTRKCYFISNVEPLLVKSVKLSESVNLEIDTGAAAVRVPGKILFISPVVDPSSGLLRIKIIFDNPEGKVRPGVAGRIVFGVSANAN